MSLWLSLQARIATLLRQLAEDLRGATAVEFALLALPFFSLVMLSLQTTTIFFFNEALQTVALQSARQIVTGQAQKAGMTQAQFHSTVCANAPSVFTCGNIMVDVQSSGSFGSVSTTPLTITYNGAGAPTNTWAYSPGNPRDIVIMRVMYDWPLLGGPLSLGLANQSNGSHLMVATTVFKVEPYQ